ncbi:uncharacterized protein BT62DRAFT_929524 [Guyanagaster necrorhizus]|uniref:Uncharacterized protein n=1 Tax=Guyanagaster necrorhizus TaxID=856835 RepID=A0A9P8AW02_9AGAR|nr:uncharacterized protein BT62DRAFT_929524 [Guyanagaster necrorhizus MCA 3950]KAG7448432.1 hypothetical protein BT62DRAFT_929524 [Guyanagaster necrorhizus MCA 3950]
MPLPPQHQQLRISFPVENWPGWDIKELSLTRFEADFAPALGRCDCSRAKTAAAKKGSVSNLAASCPVVLSVNVDAATHDDYCSDSPIFHGVAVSKSSPPIHLALKFALREDLIPALLHEAHMYSAHLEHVQGRAVPYFWGFFMGFLCDSSHGMAVDGDGEPIACLVLEYWGGTLPMRFDHLEKGIRMHILHKLGEIHQCGVHHGDFAERNVLYSDEDGIDIRIIDFDQTEPHMCGRGDKGCDVLQQVGRDMGL